MTLSIEHGCRRCKSLNLKTLTTPGTAVTTIEVLCVSCGATYIEGVGPDGHTTIVWITAP